MDNYLIFLKALQEAEFCEEQWKLFELKELYEPEDVDDMVREEFCTTKRVHGFLTAGVYVVIKQNTWLYRYLSEETLLFPHTVYTDSSKEVYLFYCLETYD